MVRNREKSNRPTQLKKKKAITTNGLRRNFSSSGKTKTPVITSKKGKKVRFDSEGQLKRADVSNRKREFLTSAGETEIY